MDHPAVPLSIQQKLNWLELVFLKVRGPSELLSAVDTAQSTPWRKRNVASLLRSILAEGAFPALFTLGVPLSGDPWKESLRRFVSCFHSPSLETNDLREWLMRTIRIDDLRWVRELGPDRFEEIIELILGDDDEKQGFWRAVRLSMVDAVQSLSMDVAMLGNCRDCRALADSSFMILALDYEILMRRLPSNDHRILVAADALLDGIQDCGERLRRSRGSSPEYLLKRADLIAYRIDLLIRVLSLADARENPGLIRELVLSLIDGAAAERDFLAPARTEASRVSHEVAELIGIRGENCITRTWKEYLKVLNLAGGGGMVTAGTSVIKFAMLSLKVPLLIGGAMISINYAGSFLLMQALGLKLASKQPSLMASALVLRLKQTGVHTQQTLLDLVDEIASITRSQVATSLGNFGVVIPATILFHFGYRWMTGHSFLDAVTARHVITSLHPLRSLTIPYAIFTGALLWISSLMGGWTERWAILRGLSERRSKTLFGISYCISMGILLGLTPAIGAALGVPLDVRHFTLSTGFMALAVCSIGVSQSVAHGMIAGVIGLLLIGFFNFSVSFLLSLTWTALVRGVEKAKIARVFGMAFRQFTRMGAGLGRFPAQFFFPPTKEA